MNSKIKNRTNMGEAREGVEDVWGGVWVVGLFDVGLGKDVVCGDGEI